MTIVPLSILKKLSGLILFVALIMPVYASDALPEPPDPPTLVADFAQILGGGQRMSLEMKLNEYNKVHGTQIAIVTIKDLSGMDPADFADRLAEFWGVGQAGRENGVLILVNPGRDNQRGNVHISVGYGLEGVIPDITAKRIVDHEILPNFREGRFYEGLDEATNKLMQLAAGEFSAEEYNSQGDSPAIGIGIFIFLIIVFILLVSKKRNSHYNVGKDIPFWTWLWLMGNASQGTKGSWGDFSSGRGSFGSGTGSFGSGRSFGGGGGFGGFGGGRFGGGGAGGSW